MTLKKKHPNIKTTFNLVLISSLVWIAESFLHILILSEDSLWGAVFPGILVHEFYMRFLVIIACGMLYLLVIKNKVIKEKEKQIESILNNVIPICITNKEYEIVIANDSYWQIWGKPKNEPVKCYNHRPGRDCHTEKCAITQIINGAQEYICESQKEYNNEKHYFIVTAKPFLDTKNNTVGIVESFQDITERKKLEDEKNSLIEQLQSSLKKVELLSGLLPICASCKKIRDDKGYWSQIESYIREHSAVEFSHSICPECAQVLYPDFINEDDTGN